MRHSNVESSLDCLSRLQDLESRLIEVGGADAKTDTVECNLLARLEDLDLLDVGVVKEGTCLEELEILRASVLDSGLHFSVARNFEGDVQW